MLLFSLKKSTPVVELISEGKEPEIPPVGTFLVSPELKSHLIDKLLPTEVFENNTEVPLHAESGDENDGRGHCAFNSDAEKNNNRVSNI